MAGPRPYKWSSYRESLVLVKPRMLGYDPTFLVLGNNQTSRNEQYKRFMQTDISSYKLSILSNALKRNQLTGLKQFIEEIGVRTGLRIANYNRGRPVSL